MIVQYENWEIPKVLVNSDLSIPELVHLASDKLSVNPTLVANEVIKVNNKIALPLFISNKDPQMAVSHQDGNLITVEDREGEIYWAHPRRLYKISSRMGISDLYGKTLDWLVSHNFAAGFLVNNLEKLL